MLGIDWVKIELSTRQIVFTPSEHFDPRDHQALSRAEDGTLPDLEVTVTNTSNRFASFQVALHAEGQTSSDTGQWYQVEPTASAKKPPGAQTTFYIKLLKAPVPGYDTTLPLTLTVFSAEQATLTATETVYLRILRPNKSLKVYFPVKNLRVHPGTKLQIPVLVYNLAPVSRKINLQLRGDEPVENWFPEGIKQSLQLESGCFVEAQFWCVPPCDPQSLRGMYDIEVEASDRNEADSYNDSAKHELEVLPFGQLKVNVTEIESGELTEKRSLWRPRTSINFFRWDFENKSNLQQHIYLQAHESSHDRVELRSATEPILAPGEYAETTLDVESKRPWLGWVRTHFVEIFPDLRRPDSGEPISEVTVQPASCMLTLKVAPIIPMWLQILVGLFGVLGIWSLWLLLPAAKHTAAVNSTVLMASGDTVVSGSRDQTLLRWQVDRAAWLPDVRRLKYLGEMGNFSKAIRVVEPLPNRLKEVAIGLENGEIQLWKIDPPEEIELQWEQSLPNRVFDLAFTQDSRYLFSAHGSGEVNILDVDNRKLANRKLFIGEGGISSSISAIDVVEQPGENSLVAIAAQYNRFILWDWENDIPYEVLYEQSEQSSKFSPVVSQNSYLTSVEVSDNGKFIVTADSTGLIKTWNTNKLRECMPDEGSTRFHQLLAKSKKRFISIDSNDDNCRDVQISQWSAGLQGSAIRGVSLTNNGCYLASTGDDGRINLWRLNEDGELNSTSPLKNVITFKGESLNSVDIHLTSDNVVLVAADTMGHRVQLYREKMGDHDCQ